MNILNYALPLFHKRTRSKTDNHNKSAASTRNIFLLKAATSRVTRGKKGSAEHKCYSIPQTLKLLKNLVERIYDKLLDLC